MSYNPASVEKAVSILLTEFKDTLQKNPQTRQWTPVEDLPKHPIPLDVAQVRTGNACNSINDAILLILPMVSCAVQEGPDFPYRHILAVCASITGPSPWRYLLHSFLSHGVTLLSSMKSRVCQWGSCLLWSVINTSRAHRFWYTYFRQRHQWSFGPLETQIW